MATLSLHPDWMGSKHDNDIGMLHRFKVKIGEYSLGGWQKVQNLSVEFKPTPITQAGFNTYQVQLLSPPTWSPIVLERAILAGANEWQLTYRYLANALGNPQQARGNLRPPGARTLIIQVNSAWGDPVRTLHFMNARPSKWEGPTLFANSTTSVATEKLTFVHEGFFPDGDLAGGPPL